MPVLLPKWACCLAIELFLSWLNLGLVLVDIVLSPANLPLFLRLLNNYTMAGPLASCTPALVLVATPVILAPITFKPICRNRRMITNYYWLPFNFSQEAILRICKSLWGKGISILCSANAFQIAWLTSLMTIFWIIGLSSQTASSKSIV